MDHIPSPDHETDILRRFAAQRAEIVRLAHQLEPVMTSDSLLKQVQQDEALEALRHRWRSSADPLDHGHSARQD